MGLYFCGFRKRTKKENVDADNGTCGELRSLFSAMKIKKRPKTFQRQLLVHGKVKDNQLHDINSSNKVVLTLEDLIVSSPNNNKINDVSNLTSDSGASDSNLHKPSSKRIHPSFDELEFVEEESFLPCKSGVVEHHFSSSNKSREEDENGGQLENSSVSLCSRKKSGGMKKKKVSFRSPEVADVFVIASSFIADDRCASSFVFG